MKSLGNEYTPTSSLLTQPVSLSLILLPTYLPTYRTYLSTYLSSGSQSTEEGSPDSGEGSQQGDCFRAARTSGRYPRSLADLCKDNSEEDE